MLSLNYSTSKVHFAKYILEIEKKSSSYYLPILKKHFFKEIFLLQTKTDTENYKTNIWLNCCKRNYPLNHHPHSENLPAIPEVSEALISTTFLPPKVTTSLYSNHFLVIKQWLQTWVPSSTYLWILQVRKSDETLQERPWFVVFADFHGVNTPIPSYHVTSLSMELGSDANRWFLHDGTNWLQDTSISPWCLSWEDAVPAGD